MRQQPGQALIPFPCAARQRLRQQPGLALVPSACPTPVSAQRTTCQASATGRLAASVTAHRRLATSVTAHRRFAAAVTARHKVTGQSPNSAGESHEAQSQRGVWDLCRRSRGSRRWLRTCHSRPPPRPWLLCHTRRGRPCLVGFCAAKQSRATPQSTHTHRTNEGAGHQPPQEIARCAARSYRYRYCTVRYSADVL